MASDDLRERIAEALYPNGFFASGTVGRWMQDQTIDAVLAVVQPELDRLRLREQHAIDYEQRISWGTTCANCASVLDASYESYVRRRTAMGLKSQYVNPPASERYA